MYLLWDASENVYPFILAKQVSLNKYKFTMYVCNLKIDSTRV